MKFYVAKINYYNESEERIDTDHICVTGKDFADAMANIEEYYGKDLDRVELELVNGERPIVILPNAEIYEKIRVEGDI